MVLAILFAAGSAFANALNVVTQRVGSTAAPAQEKGLASGALSVPQPPVAAGLGGVRVIPQIGGRLAWFSVWSS